MPNNRTLDAYRGDAHLPVQLTDRESLGVLDRQQSHVIISADPAQHQYSLSLQLVGEHFLQIVRMSPPFRVVDETFLIEQGIYALDAGC
jgi:hypothetical protein